MEDSRLYQEIKNEGRAEGRAEGEAQGEARGKAEGRAEGLRQAICALAEEKLGEVPEDLGRRLAGLDAEALSTLLKRLLRAEEREEFLACLPG